MIRKLILSTILCSLAGFISAEEVIIQSIPQPTLLKYLAGEEVFELIDARSAEEYAAGHVYNAINVPHDTDLSQSEVLPRAKDTAVVVYCKSGIRALTLKRRLDAMGYSNVRVLGPEQMMWADELPVFNCGVEAPATQVLKTVDSASLNQ